MDLTFRFDVGGDCVWNLGAGGVIHVGDGGEVEIRSLGDGCEWSFLF